MSPRARRPRGARAIAPVLVALRLVTGVALLAMIGVTLADILGRHFVGTGVAGVVEMVEFAQTWLIFLGIALAFGTGSHIVLDMVDLLLPKQAISVLVVAGGVASSIVTGWLAWLTIPELLDKADFGDRTIDLGIPLSWSWAAMLSGFVLSALLSLISSLPGNDRASDMRNDRGNGGTTA